MRTWLAAIALAVGAATAVVTFAAAQTQANGLPSYTDGWQKWPRINKKPLTAPGAHNGIKNVYASKRKVGAKYPNGTVIVKSIANGGFVNQVAVMRKVSGRWQFVEYQRPTARARYSVLAKGQLCQSCHMRARANDFVFTRG